MPLRQFWQAPQPQAPKTATGSPTSRPGTGRVPGPKASIQPAFSWPSVIGTSRRPDAENSMRLTSLWQAPAPPTRTRTWPGPGSGWATSLSAVVSSTSDEPPMSWNAFISNPLRRRPFRATSRF